jgi:hypothetical protein
MLAKPANDLDDRLDIHLQRSDKRFLRDVDLAEHGAAANDRLIW